MPPQNHTIVVNGRAQEHEIAVIEDIYNLLCTF